MREGLSRQLITQFQYRVWCILLQVYGELLIGSEHVRPCDQAPKNWTLCTCGVSTAKARAAKLLEHLLKYYNWANYRQMFWSSLKPY